MHVILDQNLVRATDKDRVRRIHTLIYILHGALHIGTRPKDFYEKSSRVQLIFCACYRNEFPVEIMWRNKVAEANMYTL